MSSIVASVITAVSALALTVGWPGARAGTWETAEKYVFSTPLSAFIAAAERTDRDARLDWTTDNCSAPVLGSAGKTYDFTDACRRHDFAYRNLARLDNGRRWTHALRLKVDNRFLADMRNHCAHRPSVQRTACRAWATLYFDTVRRFAGP